MPERQWRVWLFGSQATGVAGPGADVDIAIEGDTTLPWEMLAAIREEIEKIQTLRSIDVVDARAADDRFRARIFAHGRQLA